MQLIVIGIIAQFNVEVAEIIKQKNIVVLVTISKNITSKVERIELLLGWKFSKIGGLHTHTGLTSEINKNSLLSQPQRMTFYTKTQIPIQYN